MEYTLEELNTKLMTFKIATTPSTEVPEHVIINSANLFLLGNQISKTEEELNIRSLTAKQSSTKKWDEGSMAVNAIYENMQQITEDTSKRLSLIHQDFLQRLYDACDALLSETP